MMIRLSKNTESVRGYSITQISFESARQPMPNAMTVDVEDWYQSTVDSRAEISDRVVKNTRQILDIFAEFNDKATFFVLGLVCKKYPELVAAINAAGHEVATHGYSHKPCHRMTRRAFAEDVKRSVELIEDVIGEKVRGYRAPDFSITHESLWVLEVLAGSGIQYDSSIFPIHGPRYGIGRQYRFPHRIRFDLGREIIEFPISTVKVLGMNLPFVGGGYSRLLPGRVARLGLKRLNRLGQPGMVYMHPYEIDCTEMEDLKQVVTPTIRLWQGLNRRTIRLKMRDLMSSFEFCPVKKILDLASEQVGRGAMNVDNYRESLE